MNKSIAIIIVLLLLAGGGYMLLGKSSEQGSENSNPLVVANNKNDGQVDSQTKNDTTNYRNYSKEEFDKAKSEGKVVMLYFTANWCPTCRAQEPVNEDAFNELKNDEDIMIYKAHILDSDTTDETESLAKEYGVRLQHTFIILDSSGEIVFTHTGPLVKGDIVKELVTAKN